MAQRLNTIARNQYLSKNNKFKNIIKWEKLLELT
jgi:hypothetical protein